MGWIPKFLRREAVHGPTESAAESGTPLPRGEGPRAAVAGDNPVRQPEDDTLGRSVVARSFVQQVLALDASEGLVVGVLGPWGSGKTSFVNLARGQFEATGLPILDFNPWMFSGAEQLVESFFIELAAQLKVRPGLAEMGKDLEDYGESFSGLAWLPVVGPWIERGRGAAKILATILQRRKQGVGGRRVKLEKALASLRRPLLVVLDDIDRLSTPEIRDIFKLVRLTASFPNVIYVVAFDRQRVEKALGEQGVPGRDYLEKILQVAVDLPAIPREVLSRQVLSAVDASLSTIDKQGPFYEEEWPDIFMEIIQPLLRNMRDVRRYAAAIHGTVAALEGQIALADVLALEAIRVFLPDVFGLLHRSVEGLTTTLGSGFGGRDDPPHLKAQVQALVEAAGSHQSVVRAMVDRLFPAGERHIAGSQYGNDWTGRWLRDRRIAHADIVRLYLERVAGEGLQAFTDAEHAWTVMSNRDALDGYLRSLEAGRLQDVIGALETYEDQFAAEHVVPGTVVLLNLLPEVPERQRGMFEMDTKFVVTRVTYRLLRSLGDPAAVEGAVRKILPEIGTLSSKLELIRSVGYREGAGHKLVSESAAAEFETKWRQEVRSTSTGELARERDLVRVLLIARREAGPSEPQLEVDETPEVTLALLRAARGEVISQTMGNRGVRRSVRLAWEALVEIYGGEDTLRNRIEQVKQARLDDVGDLIELAEKYASGWRPNNGVGE